MNPTKRDKLEEAVKRLKEIDVPEEQTQQGGEHVMQGERPQPQPQAQPQAQPQQNVGGEKTMEHKETPVVEAEAVDEKLAALTQIIEPAVTFTDTTGQTVTLSIEHVKKIICPKATTFEALAFLYTARALGANPFLRQIHLVKYAENAPASIIVGRDFYLHLAYTDPEKELVSFRSGVTVFKPSRENVILKTLAAVQDTLNTIGKDAPDTVKLALRELWKRVEGLKHEVPPEGELVDIEGAVVPPGCTLYGGWAEVVVRYKGREMTFRQRVMLREYNRDQALWRTHPATMIQKVAEAQVLRHVFPLKFSGVYTPEEVGEPE